MTAAKDALSDKVDESKHNVCHTPQQHLSPDIVMTLITCRPRPTSTPTSKNPGDTIANTERDGTVRGGMAV